MNRTSQFYWHRIPSPIGPLVLTATARGLSGLFMEGYHTHAVVQPGWVPDPRQFTEACSQVEQYFGGKRRRFDLTLDFQEGTPFQRRVWAELQRIPYGTTLSYGELARRIGSPGGARAVGLANGRNPISIIVPCHRVIGADGTLTGYGGGLANKKALLELEGRESEECYAPPLPMASTGQPSMASLH